MKENKKGSALLWTVIVILVISITIAAGFAISFSYYNRSIALNNSRQAYLTAKGVIENIVNNLSVSSIEEPNEYVRLCSDLPEGMSKILTIDLPDGIGEIESATIEKKNKEDTKGRLTISITASYVDAKETVKADMQLGKKDSFYKWQLIRYYKGDSKEVETSVNSKAAQMYFKDMVGLVNASNHPPINVTAEQSLINKIKTDDPIGFQRLYKMKPDHKLYLDNDSLRTYFYYREEEPGFISYDKSAVKNQVLIEKIKGDVYIQPYIPSDKFDVCFVFASKLNDLSKLDSTEVHLIYNPDDGHWYYIDQVYRNDFINGYVTNADASGNMLKLEPLYMTNFDSGSNPTPGNTSIERWNRFKAKYLIPENIIE